MKILDCTLRDGGYYTNWDFPEEITSVYFRTMNNLPVDYLEIGYRSREMPEYEGEYFYTPVYVIEQIKRLAPDKKLAIMLNEKGTRPEDLPFLLEECKGLIDMVRIAVDPRQFERAVTLAGGIKAMGFNVAFNMMYMSTLTDQSPVLGMLGQLGGIVDIFNLVDSYGGVYPEQVTRIVETCKTKTTVPLGFHGHNNIELAFANFLAAEKAGCTYVDSTVTGMGRGAGNLKTELLLTHLASQAGVQVDFNELTAVVTVFEDLRKKHEWGTNLPYMVSGSGSLPQKDVMDWVTKRYYSMNSIVRALQNQKSGSEDNLRLPVWNPEKKFKKALLIAGGPSVKRHQAALRHWIDQNRQDLAVIHVSSKNAGICDQIQVPQFFCLVGNEGHRLESVFTEFSLKGGMCILPPFPRKMGTYIPGVFKDRAAELEKIDFTDKFLDSHTAIALQTVKLLGAEEIFTAGYDGYSGSDISVKELDLISENEYMFGRFKAVKPLKSLTGSNYEGLLVSSVYAGLSASEGGN